MKPSVWSRLFGGTLFVSFVAASAAAQQSPTAAEPAPPAAEEPGEAVLPPAPTPETEALPPPPPPQSAAPSEPAPPPPQLIQVETPPPKEPVQRSKYLHDGFYLRLSIGGGRLAHSVSTDTRSLSDFSTAGGGLIYDVLIGGSPEPGIAVGGGLIGFGTTGSDVEVDDRDTGVNADTSQGLIGVFVDGFPKPNGGFHLGGLIGLAGVRLDPATGAERTLGGFGGAVWGGYDAWVGSEWSLGGKLQLTGSITNENDDGVKWQATSFGVSLLFTALYH